MTTPPSQKKPRENKEAALEDAQDCLWSIIQSFGYKLDAKFAYELADEHFKNFKHFSTLDLPDTPSAESPAEFPYDQFMEWCLADANTNIKFSDCARWGFQQGLKARGLK